MKVLQFINTLDSNDGGPARNSFELNLSLNKLSNTQVNLIWMRGNLANSIVADASERLPSPGPRKLGLRTRSSERVVGVATLMRELARTDAVLIHGYYLTWIPVIAAVCRALRKPFVITPHGSLTRHQRSVSPLKKSFYEAAPGKMVRAWSSGFITGSRVEAEELLEAFPGSSVHVGGVGTSLAVPTVHNEPSAGELRLLSLSRIAPKKRVDLMIDALAELVARGRDARLTVAGSGDPALLAALKAQAARLGVAGHVAFVGAVRGAGKDEAFANADIFLLPSDDENFGIGLAEALAHGLPSIVSDRVASSSAMSTNSGRVITAPTGPSIAAAIEDLSLDLLQARTAARRSAEENFDWTGVARMWRHLLASKVS